MTKLNFGNASLLAAWCIGVALSISCSRIVAAMRIRMAGVTLSKEFAALFGIALVLVIFLGKKFGGFVSKDNSKIRKAQRKPVTSQPVQTSSNARSGPTITRMEASKVTEKHIYAAPVAPSVVVAPLPPPQENRQLSKRPVLPPTFVSTQFDDQVDELSHQLLPTEGCIKVVQQIAQDIKKVILGELPYADVVGFTVGEVSRGTAYGVAVPEVDIVVNLPPHILVRTMAQHISKLNFTGKVDDRRLHKSGLRLCTDLLVTSGGFKFRRSAFRGRDPKVTLMAPRSFDSYSCIPIDFSVNAATPLCNWVLTNACARVDPRTRMLILLVKRWAKDRGICHAAKGHLMPYAFTLLCIYFLQVGVKGGSLLPPLKHLRLAPGQDNEDMAGLDQCMQGWVPPKPGSALAKKRLGQLFKEFIHFYVNEVDWRTEMASIRSGTRSPPHRSLQLTVLETPSGMAVGPTIEDPFMPNENMSELLSVHGWSRFTDELARAQACFENNAPLSEILTQWVPADFKSSTDVADGSGSGDEAEALKDESANLSSKDVTQPDEAPAPPVAASPPISVPPWRKNKVATLSAEAKDVPSLPKPQMTPPPGLWAANGQPPKPWPSPTPNVSSAAAA